MVRFNKILKDYKPFFYFLIFALLNEILSEYLSTVIRNNSTNSNIYILIEFFLLLSLFKNWGYHTRKNNFYISVGVAVTVTWILDNLIFHTLTTFNSAYRIVYSLVLVFLSIDEINFIIITERKNVIKNARFLICSAFIFFFSYKALVETFFLIEAPFSIDFYRSLLDIMAFINLFTNLIYILAALWIPTKQRFLLPYQ